MGAFTASTALRLAKLLKTSPEFWMNLQAAWDLQHFAGGIPSSDAVRVRRRDR
jgi:addiction module HigA family antidote